MIGSVRLALNAGPLLPGPAPAELLSAVRSVEVVETDGGACTFELAFGAEAVDAAQFAIAASTLLEPFSRVLLRVLVDGDSTTLVDGFITKHSFEPSSTGESRLVVSGEDISVAMDIVDYSREFPVLPDGAIVLAVLAPYLALGIVPEVSPLGSSLVPYDHVPQQAGTDRATIRQLAEQNGFVFYVRPLSLPFTNIAYWGPPQRDAAPSAVLDVVTGPFSTVESASFTLDALAPTAFFGLVMEKSIDPYVNVPLLTVGSDRMPPLATDPVMTPLTLAGWTRKKLWNNQELDPIRAQLVAQGCTNVSTDNVVSGTIEVDPLRLGTIVHAPGVVGVRGAGSSYDGLFYLRSATHRISLGADGTWNYRESLTVAREGLGSTVSALAPV